MRSITHLLDRAILKLLLLLCFLVIGSGYGQSSHRDITSELVRDLKQAISDSTSIPSDSLDIQFVDDSNLGNYLNGILTRRAGESGQIKNDLIEMEIIQLEISMNRDKSKSVRNPRFLRQLDLKVTFEQDQQEYTWHGKISDKVSRGQLKRLLDEDYPVIVRGDYINGEPATILIIMTTLGVFSLGAALFFIRT